MKVRDNHWLRGPCERGVSRVWQLLVFYNVNTNVNYNANYNVNGGLVSYNCSLSLSLLPRCIPSVLLLHYIDVSKLVPSKPWNLTLFPLRTMSIRKGFEESRGIITRVHSKRFNLIQFQSGKARRERVRRDARQDRHDMMLERFSRRSECRFVQMNVQVSADQCTMCCLYSKKAQACKMPCGSHRAISDCHVVDTGE